MKKIFLLALCAALVLSLAACGPSEQIKHADALISAIGTVTLASGEAIENAENACAALDEGDLARVEQYETLLQARADYDALCAQKAIDAIDAIGEVTLQSADAINAAQVALGALSEAQRALVKNADALEQAKHAYFNVQVQQIEDAISAIGKVTLDSEGAIAEAWAIYDRYDSDIQAAVSNLQDLEQAGTALFVARVQDVERAISAIGTVNLQSGEAIAAARAVFESYDAEVQAAVTNRSALTDAEAAFEALRIAEARDAIAAIGEVTLQSGEAIAEARAVFDALPKELQEKTENRTSLTDAELELARLKAEARQQAIDEALSELEVQADMPRGIRWYYAACEPYYADERSFVLPYLGIDADNAWIRLKYHYTGTQWVFFEKVILTVDGETYVQEFDYFDIHRDNDSEVWEWVDVEPSEQEMEMLRRMVQSERTTVRFESNGHSFEFTVTDGDKKGIEQVLVAYDLLMQDADPEAN